jgi:hypothetical protein
MKTAPIHWGDALSFLLAVTAVTSRLRRRDLLRLLRGIEAAKARSGSIPAPEAGVNVGILTRAFDRLRVWCYSAEDACLKDSLVLAYFLLSRGALPTFVMGIRTKPFGAHAWVQSGDVVLNDSVENVQRYTPIVVI